MQTNLKKSKPHLFYFLYIPEQTDTGQYYILIMYKCTAYTSMLAKDKR